jgi:stearoyl-CoA desaturase (delta-9 desaturase)
VENLAVSMAALGEGWHNYHHVFPHDYKTSELGPYSLNPSTAFIDFFAWLGWAYDLKSVSKEWVRWRSERSGDNTRGIGPGAWGWGDKDLPPEDVAHILTKTSQHVN